MAKERWIGELGGPMIIIMLLGAILFYLFFVPPAERAALIPGFEEDYSHVVLYETPGVVRAASGEVTEVDRHDLGSVVLDYTPKQSSTLLISQLAVRKSILSDDSVTLNFEVPDKESLVGVELSMNILDKKGRGQLVVLINDSLVLQTAVSKDSNLRIPISPLDVGEGANKLTIRTTGPSFNILSTNEYVISDVYLIVRNYGVEGSRIDQYFSVSSEELLDADTVMLSALVRRESAEPAMVSLDFNGNSVYSNVPGAATTLSLDLPVELLLAGINQLTWSVEEGGKYTVSFVSLDVERTDVAIEGEAATYFFNVDPAEFTYIAKDFYVCELTMRKRTGSDNIEMKLNNFMVPLTFVNGELSGDACDFLTSGTNKMTLTSKDETDIDLVRLEIRSV